MKSILKQVGIVVGVIVLGAVLFIGAIRYIRYAAQRDAEQYKEIATEVFSDENMETAGEATRKATDKLREKSDAFMHGFRKTGDTIK